jgi:hypothetical protein
MVITGGRSKRRTVGTPGPGAKRPLPLGLISRRDWDFSASNRLPGRCAAYLQPLVYQSVEEDSSRAT